MLNNKLTVRELEEVKLYVKKQSKKLKKEGSTTAGVPGFQTPYAFNGEEGGDGTTAIKLTDPQCLERYQDAWIIALNLNKNPS